MKKLVVESFETPDKARCADIFRRADLSYGFEIYRLDPETKSGWFPVGGFSNKRFISKSVALEVATKHAPWIT